MTILPKLPRDFADQDKGPMILAVCCTLTTLATFFVAARLYVRIRILARVGLDDWLIILSMLCGYIMLGLTIAAVRAGNGRHFTLLTEEQRSGAILYTLAGFCPGIFSFGIPKLAVVALLTKVTNPSRKHKIFLWSMTGGCLFILFGCVIILYAQCTPSRSQWDFSVQGTCWSPWVLIYYAIVAGAISAAADLYLAIYPAVVLYRLRISRKRKVALSVALGLGSIAAAVAVYKSTRLPALASHDFSYDAADITVWTSIEGNSIIVAACIPTLQPLFDQVFGRGLFGSTQDSQKYNGYKSHSGPRVELVTIGSKAHRISRQRKKMGVSDTTVRQDSQESILSSECRRTTGGQSSELERNDGIIRTHQVTVAYEKTPAVGNNTEHRRVLDMWGDGSRTE